MVKYSSEAKYGIGKGRISKGGVKSIEVQGRTSQEAIKIALKQLGVSRKEVKIEILAEEHKGLFGMIGARPARVKVTLKK